MTAPRRLTHGWTAPDGSRWRIGDIAVGPPLARAREWVSVEPGDARATTRVFAEVGSRQLRTIMLLADDRTALDDASLASQWRRGETWRERPMGDVLPAATRPIRSDDA